MTRRIPPAAAEASRVVLVRHGEPDDTAIDHTGDEPRVRLINATAQVSC